VSFLVLLQDTIESVTRYSRVFFLDQLQDYLRWNRFRDFSLCTLSRSAPRLQVKSVPGFPSVYPFSMCSKITMELVPGSRISRVYPYLICSTITMESVPGFPSLCPFSRTAPPHLYALTQPGRRSGLCLNSRMFISSMSCPAAPRSIGFNARLVRSSLCQAEI
jgi:hypothetical protein